MVIWRSYFKVKFLKYMFLKFKWPWNENLKVENDDSMRPEQFDNWLSCTRYRIYVNPRYLGGYIVP